MVKPYWESLFDDGGLYIEGDAELMKKLNEARVQCQKPDDSPLESRLSLIAGAVASIGWPLPMDKRIQTCATAEKDLEGYLIKAPLDSTGIEIENHGIPVFDLLTTVERAKESQLYEAVRRAKFEEYARLEAREEWEVDKQAAALPSLDSAPAYTAEKRQAERWQMCVDRGLKMPKDTFAHYPRGIGKVAKILGIERPSLREDLDKYRERTMGK